MTGHRLLAACVSLGLAVCVGAAAMLWPFETERIPETTLSREVLTEVPSEYRPEQASFALQVGDIVTPYRVFAVFIMPGERVDIDVVLPMRTAHYALEALAGSVIPSGDGSWTWRAPDEAGVYPIHVDELPTGETMTLNAVVMVPFEADESTLNGYRIGQYERRALNDDPVYEPPAGFVEVTRENASMLVSPHFTLGQFLCKQESDFPKYMLLREQLVLKLERILHDVNERGTVIPTLHVMSGYRTPYYNRSIGNRTSYSRHLYGGAADVYVDQDGDRYMDDLTDDGQVDRADARYLAGIVEDQRDEPWYRPLTGGIGIYGTAPHRGPFIHVDVRGKAVRW